jgi:hypothetical protein
MVAPAAFLLLAAFINSKRNEKMNVFASELLLESKRDSEKKLENQDSGGDETISL